jgi:PRTRC genetic system protein B
MEADVDMSAARPFRLKRAVLVYEEEGYDGRTYASVHPVLTASRDARPRLGPGTPATNAFVRTLIRGLGAELKAEFLPDTVLYRADGMLVWWSRPGIRTLFFQKGSEVAKLSGEDFPIPPLLWKVSANGLSLRALEDDKRPAPDTALFVAPFWNTSPWDGNVCEGSMQKPGTAHVADIEPWMSGYFKALFTHAYGAGDLTRHKGGHKGLWSELAGKKKFPRSYLTPAAERGSRAQTVESFVKGL